MKIKPKYQQTEFELNTIAQGVKRSPGQMTLQMKNEMLTHLGFVANKPTLAGEKVASHKYGEKQL